jgi:hypothetical protein
MKQVAAIERVDRLRRFLGPQVAQVIASSDAPDSILASHDREVTVRSATCADSAPLPRRPSPKRSWRSCGNIRKDGTAHLPI